MEEEPRDERGGGGGDVEEGAMLGRNRELAREASSESKSFTAALDVLRFTRHDPIRALVRAPVGPAQHGGNKSPPT